MPATSNNVKVVTARTAETFRGPFKGREFDKVSETAEQLAKQLKKNHIEDRSTLVNNSNILREAIEQVLSFLESVRVLKVLVNYWNLTFALFGKEMVISRDPENQLLMKVVDSSVVHSFGELEFPSLSNSVKQMFGDAASGVISKDDEILSSLGDKIREPENETKVSQEMINQLGKEKEELCGELLDAKARQSQLQNEESFSGDEELEEDETEEAGSEKRKQRNHDIKVLGTCITNIESDINDHDALTEQHGALFATQAKELKKLKREQSVR